MRIKLKSNETILWAYHQSNVEAAAAAATVGFSCDRLLEAVTVVALDVRSYCDSDASDI